MKEILVKVSYRVDRQDLVGLNAALNGIQSEINKFGGDEVTWLTTIEDGYIPGHPTIKLEATFKPVETINCKARYDSQTILKEIEADTQEGGAV